MHRDRLGCTLAFQDLNLIAHKSIGVHFGICISKFGCTWVHRGALLVFEGFNLGSQGSTGVHFGISRSQFGCTGLDRGAL